jgi:hypothetical protein
MAQFEEEKARLMALYGGTARDALGKRAQAFAQLYARSGWTQVELAEVEKMSQSRMQQLLLFGRFLITTNGGKGSKIKERKFRVLFQRTDRALISDKRIDEVRAMLEAEPPHASQAEGKATRQLGKQLAAQFRDGKFHRLRDMADALDADMDVLRGTCDRIVSQGTFQTFGERRPAPPKDGLYAYRFVKGGKKKIDLTVFRSEVQPVLDDMQMVISGPRKSDFTREAMQTAFAQLLKVLDSIAR